MFNVRFVKIIWTHPESVVAGNRMVDGKELAVDPQFATVERSLLLPFPPYAGLEVSGDGWDSGPIQSVRWLSGQQCFRCTLRDEYPRIVYGDHISYHDLLRMSIQDGWHRPEQGRGTAPL